MNPANSPKTFRKTTYTTFSSTAELLALSPRELVLSLGYTEGTANKWEKDNEIPFVAGLACEALLAKAAKPDQLASLFLVRPPAAQAAMLSAMLSAMSIPFTILEQP